MKPRTGLKFLLPMLSDADIQVIERYVAEQYRKGYNDNARDCYCDSPGATEGVIPHHHLMDDGKSHDIRPDTLKQEAKV